MKRFIFVIVALSFTLTATLAVAQTKDDAVHAAEAVLRRIPPGQRPPPAMFAAHLWALSHGVVELFARAGPAFGTTFSSDELLERGIAIYLRGLGVEPGDE